MERNSNCRFAVRVQGYAMDWLALRYFFAACSQRLSLGQLAPSILCGVETAGVGGELLGFDDQNDGSGFGF